MIPKRAFFLWVGKGPLPWLRQLGIDTFEKYNPDWTVDLIRVPIEAGLLAAQSTDIFRYHYLYEYGGLYLDTDIVFFRPVPEEILDAGAAITIDRAPIEAGKSDPRNEHSPGFTNLAFLGSVKGNPLFKFAYSTALERLDTMKNMDIDMKRTKGLYQAFGTAMLDKEFTGKTQEDIEVRFGTKIHNVPLETVLPVGWHETDRLFTGGKFDPPEKTIGVHWYGGCPDASRYCAQMTRETYLQRPCYLSSAIDRALA